MIYIHVKWIGIDMKKIILAVLIVMLCGCNNATTTPNKDGQTAVIFTDALNREIKVENPQRVAALLGSFAHVWTLAGGEVIASADDAWEDFAIDMPEDAVNLGHTKRLNLELLLGAKPDFIIATTNTRINVEWKETLEKA